MKKKSILGLVDFNGLKVADEVVSDLIGLTEFCSPYFKATAMLAKEEATIDLGNAVINHFGKINMPIYEDEEQAKEWLFTQ